MSVIKSKLNIQQESIFHQAGIEIIRQKEKWSDDDQSMMELPYIFKDPIKFDKKTAFRVFNISDTTNYFWFLGLIF